MRRRFSITFASSGCSRSNGPPGASRIRKNDIVTTTNSVGRGERRRRRMKLSTIPSPLRAGLSHMGEESDEAPLVPPCFPHFAGDRLVERAGAEDVVGKPSDDGKVLRSVVLAGAGVVLVEDHVEGPMELVFDAPVGPHDLGKPAWRDDPRQGHVPDRGGAAPVRADALGLDAAERLEAREVRPSRQSGNRQDRGAPALGPSAAVLVGLEGGELAGPGKARLGGGKERAVVAFEAERILGLAASTASAMAGWQWSASAVTVQPLRLRPFRSASVAFTSEPPGARAAAMASRVSASQTLTIRGGRWARPLSYPRRSAFASTATTPCGGGSPSPCRSAVMKAAKARASSSGSRRRSTREKVSCEGGPCRSRTISRRSSSRPSAKSAISTQLFAPHKVAASAMNKTSARSCRAFASRGSRTSRKIARSAHIGLPPHRERPLRIHPPTRGKHQNTQMRFPCPSRGGRSSMRERVGAHLDVHGAGLRALAALLEPGRAVA